jgi:CRP-like cAMP-binding protein
MSLSPASLSLLKAYLSRFVSLSEAEFEQFCRKLISKKLKRKEVFLRQGEVCKQVAFITQGCLRYFCLVEAEEHTGQF